MSEEIKITSATKRTDAPHMPAWIDREHLMMPTSWSTLPPEQVGRVEVTIGREDITQLIEAWCHQTLHPVVMADLLVALSQVRASFVTLSGDIADGIDDFVDGPWEPKKDEFIAWAEFLEAQAKRLREAAISEGNGDGG